MVNIEPRKKSFSKKYKNLAIISLAIVILVVILVSPIIPIQSTVTKTRTRNLRYSNSEVFINYVPIGNYVPCINVTNQDSVGGDFSVTISYWDSTPEIVGKQPNLLETFSKSIFINAGATQQFSPSNVGNWGFQIFCFYYTYSVSAPNKQESYQENQTEYKSILSLIESLLGM